MPSLSYANLGISKHLTFLKSILECPLEYLGAFDPFQFIPDMGAYPTDVLWT